MVATQQRLGALLVDMGFIDDAQLASALEEQQRSEKRLGKILVEASVISEDRLVHALSRQLGIEACDPIMTRVHERVLALLSPAVAFEYRVIPVARQRETDRRDVVYVATADPLDQDALAAVSAALGDEARVQWMLAGETEMELALNRHYGPRPARLPEGTKVITGVPVTAPRADSAGQAPAGGQSPAPAQDPSPNASSRSSQENGLGPQGSDTALSVLATTDDIYAALSDVVPDGAITQPDRPAPPNLEPAPGAPARPDAAAGRSEMSTEEILVAEDVVTGEEDDGTLLPVLGSESLTSLDVPIERAVESEIHDSLGLPEPRPIEAASSSLEAELTAPDEPEEADLGISDPPRAGSSLAPFPLIANGPLSGPRSASMADAMPGANANEIASREKARRPTDEDALLLGAGDGAVPMVETPDIVRENPPPFADTSWGDLLSVGGSVQTFDDDIDIDVTEVPGLDNAALAEVGRVAEAMPVAEPSMSSPAPAGFPVAPAPPAPVASHPASPFPPLEGVPGFEDLQDEPLVDLSELVAKINPSEVQGDAEPAGLSAEPRRAPTVRPHEQAHNLHRELMYFVTGGAVDLTSQQRLLRTMAMVMMKEGLLEPSKIKAALEGASSEDD